MGCASYLNKKYQRVVACDKSFTILLTGCPLGKSFQGWELQ
jgi:hypothetical protein